MRVTTIMYLITVSIRIELEPILLTYQSAGTYVQIETNKL